RRFAWWGTSSVMSAGARPFAASATATDCGISTDADLNTSRPSITARCFPWRISDSLMYGSCASPGASTHRSSAWRPPANTGGEAELALEEHTGAGFEVMGGAGAVRDAVEVGGAHAGLRERLARRGRRETRAGLAVRDPVAGLDAAALHDPFVRRVHQLREIVVGDDALRDVERRGDELGARHRGSLRAEGGRRGFRSRPARAREARISQSPASSSTPCGARGTSPMS